MSIESFDFGQRLKENKNMPKERIYNLLLDEVHKGMLALDRGKTKHFSQISGLNIISVDDAKDIVERVHRMNSDLKWYVSVDYETDPSVDYLLNNNKTPLTYYEGRRLRKLCLVVNIK